MPLVSKAQRRFLWANHPDVAAKFEKETPNGVKLPERAKKAYADGAAAALTHFGFKTAGEELRLKIPTRTFHGFDAAHKAEASRNAKKANTSDNSEMLEQIFEQLDEPRRPGDQKNVRDPLDRSTAWSAPTNPSGGSANDVGQPNAAGAVF